MQIAFEVCERLLGADYTILVEAIAPVGPGVISTAAAIEFGMACLRGDRTGREDRVLVEHPS
jgi:hypothetical protein